MSGAARTHTLGEILLDHRTAEEKVKGAVRGAPFWVIAVAGHLVLAFVLGMVVLRHEMAKDAPDAITSEIRNEPADLKIEEVKPETPDIQRFEVPRLEDQTDLPELIDNFDTTCTLTFNPDATETSEHGLSDGQVDGPANLMTESMGGKGLAGAIGPGSGSGPGGGARKGSPNGGTRID